MAVLQLKQWLTGDVSLKQSHVLFLTISVVSVADAIAIFDIHSKQSHLESFELSCG